MPRSYARHQMLVFLLCMGTLWQCHATHTPNIDADIYDPKHGVKMGIPEESCDDGKHGIEIDWSPNSYEETICYHHESVTLKLAAMEPKAQHFFDRRESPNDIVVQHICLNEPITYPTDLPMSGNHRPLWPKYGEYRYLPPQRWLHTLEHGGVALLYHPCMKDSTRDKDTLEYLKNLVRHCVRKHVITPYKKIPDDMPYALVAFGVARIFRFEKVKDDHLVESFIKDWALRGPETRVTGDGQYSVGFNSTSVKGLPDLTDTRLCPKTPVPTPASRNTWQDLVSSWSGNGDFSDLLPYKPQTYLPG